jgi:hypothetical protein
MKTIPVLGIQDCADEELIQLTLKGCNQAFDQLIHRYERLVIFLVKRYIVDYQGIESPLGSF